MTIDWNAFTPWSALAGGALIGLAAALLVLLNGRVADISSIVGGLLMPARLRTQGDRSWRLAFVAGLVATPLLYGLVAPAPTTAINTSWLGLVAAGLLVGLGTRAGAGCTSGHGVCGLSRLSLRSAVATLCFMGAGFATVFVLRHVLA
jgi:uncharacterized protein